MATVQGLFNTGGMPPKLAKSSFASLITRYMPNGQAPLFALTSYLKTENAIATEHGFWSKAMIFPSLTMTASAAAGVTTLAVASTENMIPGMLLRVHSTGENIIINSVIDSVSVQVSRGVGTVAAATIPNAAKLYQIGNAYEEGSLRPNALAITPVLITNYTQIFRNSWAITDTLRQVMTAAGDSNVAESKLDCATFHAADIEKNLFFGQKSIGTRNGQPFRTMDGLINIVGNINYYPPSYSTPNIFTAGSTTNYTQLEGYLEPTFNQATDPKAANERLVFVGGTAKTVINNIGRLNGNYQLVDGQTNFGLQFSTFKTTRGTFRLIEHPMFNSNPDWAKMAVAVDLSSFTVAYLGDRKTQSKEFNTSGAVAQDHGIDALGGTLTTELTTVVRNAPANSVINNLTAGAKDPA